MGTAIKEMQCADWSAFEKKVKSCLGGDLTDYIFRGQYNSDWPLESSFQRFLKSYGITKSLGSGKPFESLMDIYIPLYRKSVDNISLTKIDGYINIGQHYGLPTIYLDWTENIDKAVFFSCCDEVTNPSKHDYVSVYSFKKDNIQDLVDEVKMKEFLQKEGIKLIQKFGIDIVYPNEDVVNDRIDRQKGLFIKIDDILINQNTDLVMIIQEMYKIYNIKKPIMYKFIIPRNLCLEKLKSLHDKSDINFNTMFHDRYGCASQSKFLFIINNT